MLSFGGAATRVYLAVGATDLRKGFDGLYGLVKSRLESDATSGHLFVFCNAGRRRLKVLYFDGSGLWVCAKTHAPHCSDWKFFTDSLPQSSTLRARRRSVRCGWRVERHSVYRATEQDDTRHSCMDV
jgi:transposase